MDSNSKRQDDLSDVERRLSSWRPQTEGLSRDAMLYAAGLAAGRTGHGQRLWPTICAALAVAAVAVGAWGLNERHECQLLLGQLDNLRDRAQASTSLEARSVSEGGTAIGPPQSSLAYASGFLHSPSAENYLVLRKKIEQDPGQWLASRESIGPTSLGPAPPEPRILRASQYEALLNQ